MDDLKKLSMDRLRELARKHLGKGHSRLRTRAQLLAALKAVVREPLSRLLDAAESVVPHAREKVRVVEFPPGRKGRVRAQRSAAEAPAPSGAKPSKSAGVGRASERGEPPPSSRGKGAVRSVVTADQALSETSTGAPRAPAAQVRSAARTGPRRGGRARPTRTAPANGAPPAPGSGPEPLPHAAEMQVEEAFFETPATPRRPRRAPPPAEPFEPEPFASPREVGTDAPVLLVRDPTTLFVFWDFRRELERGAALGLREPRLLLRLYRGQDLDRSLELPLATRSTYVTGLSSGQEYTAEVLLLGRDGWTRPVGFRSGGRRLPPGRVSTRLEVRTLRLPWSEPLSGAPAPSAASAPRHEPLDSPRRVPLPTSPGARGPRGAGPSGGPRSGRN